MTLQDLCLDIIITNFKRFHCAYLGTEDLREKLKYEYLRRKFSFEIAQRLNEMFELREEFLDFLLNKHLKSLDTCWFQSVSWENILNKLTEIGPSLEKVYFNSMHQWDQIICHLPNLLYASFYECSDSDIKMIAEHCPKLRSIEATSYSFSKDGLKPLCGNEKNEYPCPDLREINLDASTNFPDLVMDQNVGHLIKSLPFLENLEYSNLPSVLYSLHKGEINALDKVKPYSLTKLFLKDLDPSDQTFDDTLKICVNLCPNLKTFSCPIENANQLKLCSQLSKLENLHLINNFDQPIDLTDFLRLRGSSLTSLTISKFSLSLSLVLGNCSKLTRLHLDKIDFQEDETDTKAAMPKLVDLSFKNLILIEAKTDRFVTSILAASPNLQLLSFKSCELYSPDIKAAIMKCCELNKLQMISFRNAVIDAKFIQDVLVTCSSLGTLDLENSELSDGEDFDIEARLESIAESLPNQPLVLFSEDHNSDYTDDYDHFDHDYDDYFNTEFDDYDDDYDYDPDDYDYDPYGYCADDF